MEHDEREQAEQNIEAVKPELEKNYKEIIEKIIKKDRHHK